VITGIVLAGGASRRFGTDKLAAELDGATLLSRAIGAVRAVAGQVIVAGSEQDGSPGDQDEAVIFVADREPSAGPLVALADVLASLARAPAAADPRHDLAVVVGGDMPRLVPAVLSRMLERLNSDVDVEAVLLEAPGARRRQVLPLALRVEPATRAAAAAIERGDRSLVRFADRLVTAELVSREWRALDPAGDSLADIDTPGDLDRLRPGRPGRMG